MLTCSTTDYCSHNSCESFGHASLHTYPLSLHSSWHWETFIQSSCQIVQFFRFINRQKGDQFFYQLSDFCENCNPHSSYHTLPPPLVNVWLIFDLEKHETDFVYMFKDFSSIWKNHEFIAYSNWQFEHAVLYVTMGAQLCVGEIRKFPELVLIYPFCSRKKAASPN